MTTYSTNTQNIRKPISRDDAVVIELLERFAQVGDDLLIRVRHRLAEEVQVPSTERARSLYSVARCVVDSEYESTLLEAHLLQRPTHILIGSVLLWYRCSRTRETTLRQESLGSKTFRSIDMYTIVLTIRLLKMDYIITQGLSNKIYAN